MAPGTISARIKNPPGLDASRRLWSQEFAADGVASPSSRSPRDPVDALRAKAPRSVLQTRNVLFQMKLHRQNDAELRITAHHSRVSLASLFEWIGLNHRTNPGQLRKPQCVFGIGWRTGRPALDGATSADQLDRRDLDGFG